MVLRIVYPSWHCSRYQPFSSFDCDDITLFAFYPRFRRRRNDPFRELENIFEEYRSCSCDKKRKSSDSNDKKIFKYDFNLKGFQPNDVKIKAIGQKLVVEAENEENRTKTDLNPTLVDIIINRSFYQAERSSRTNNELISQKKNENEAKAADNEDKNDN